ncbi:WD repeat-containing protein 6 [Thrips palmi]|uniref:tRNA (34-2'-O)-methyltransferase regulator WDR6 n=1 Tax=Thrips palmi TaxID=161013 RepID=A0A6P8YP53_THRPL|nr:WD repeat-containing protein 6 [Thrips palmi]
MPGTISFRNVFISTDVICVKFFGPYVFAGVGGILKIFELLTKTCVKEVEVFKGHKIYGIEPGEKNLIIIFGSKSVRVFKFSHAQTEIQMSCVASISLEDWVLTAHWLSDDTQISLVTAHNVIWLWSWSENDKTELMRAGCSEKCILYSATVCGKDWESCVVFAGTVFREVVIWLPSGSGMCDQPVLHRLVGHNGVIFSLTWDWQTSSLCSTSDDRSIRLWEFSFPHKSDWQSSTVTCSNVFYGHSARVWRSIMFENFIVSVGEDNQICVWSRNGNLLQSINRSTSGCQWSVDCSAKHQLMVTGAGDGSIQLLPPPSPRAVPTAITGPFPEDLLRLIDSPCVRKLAFLSSGVIVAATEDGTILRGDSISTPWEIVCKDVRFSNYCVLSVAPSRTKFSIASLRGEVILYQCTAKDGKEWTLEQQLEDGKIWSLLWLSDQEILVCGDEGRLRVWQISPEQGVNMKCIGQFTLPRSRERWPTCGRLLTKNSQNFLLCGDRCGSLHLFSLSGFSQAEVQFSAPDHSLPKLHGKLGVTSVMKHHGKIFSTGRDGSVKMLAVNSDPPQLLLLSTDKMVMDWVCSVITLPSDNKNFLIVGFKEMNMIVWSTSERRTILQIDCGGGHRSWDCMVSSKENLELTYVREKQIYYSSRALETLMKPTLQCGISPRELNSVSILPLVPSGLLFGGEDGTLYVCKFSGDISTLVSRATLTSHISSVRCICVQDNFFFSAGGRAQLKAWQIEHGSDEEISCVELASHMLKGERHPRSPPSIDPEMRYMSLCCIPSTESNSVVQLISGCSDGAMRWLTFDSFNKTFQVVSESMFHTKCVLKLLTVPLNQGKVALISSATDGMIALWDILPEMFTSNSGREPIWSSRCHQSGVNSLHAQVLPTSKASTILVASGGDDNSVVLTALTLGDKEVSMIAQWSNSSAHAAQVTGVWLVGAWLLSTSIDQRLTVWRWKLELEGSTHLTCDFVSQTICSVPDVQDMQIWRDKDFISVCVVGKGVQIVQIPLKPEL